MVDSFMGGWCDLFGKRFPMFLPAVGGFLSSIVYICVVSIDSLGVEWLCLGKHRKYTFFIFSHNFSHLWLYYNYQNIWKSIFLIASFLSGICGGVTSVIANCFSYVAAISDKESRTLRVSVVEGMQFVAATIGPFLSKLIKTQLGVVFVFAGRFILLD